MTPPSVSQRLQAVAGLPGLAPSEPNPPPLLSPGTRLGKYTIVRWVGTGGMGTVYEAIHEEIGKHVALKVLSPAVDAIPGGRARFLREAQLVTRVRHPHIIDVTDMGTEGEHTFLVMELLTGHELGERVDHGGAIPTEELVDIILPVCSAMVAAHEAGIVHRDLKPQNIFLETEGHHVHPKVLDFGISKGEDAALRDVGTLTAPGAMMGTPYYLAPEQVMDAQAAGPASDQYAIGVILYECLTGVRPYEGDSLYAVFQAIVNGTPRPLREIRPEVPAEMEAIVLRAMSTQPGARFSSMNDLGRALLPFASPRARLIWEESFSDAGATDAFGGRTWPSSSATTPVRETSAPARVPSLVIPTNGRRWLAIATGLALAGGMAVAWSRAGGDPRPSSEPKMPSAVTRAAPRGPAQEAVPSETVPREPTGSVVAATPPSAMAAPIVVEPIASSVESPADAAREETQAPPVGKGVKKPQPQDRAPRLRRSLSGVPIVD